MTNGKMTIDEVGRILERIETKIDNMDGRVDTLEIWRAGVEGKIAATVIVGGIIISFVVDWIKERMGMR